MDDNFGDNNLDKLNKNIENLKLAAAKQDNALRKEASSGFNIAVELLAGVMVGTLIGIFFDRQLNSAPLCLILCIMLGFVASFKNLWMRVNKKNGS